MESFIQKISIYKKLINLDIEAKRKIHSNILAYLFVSVVIAILLNIGSERYYFANSLRIGFLIAYLYSLNSEFNRYRIIPIRRSDIVNYILIKSMILGILVGTIVSLIGKFEISSTLSLCVIVGVSTFLYEYLSVATKFEKNQVLLLIVFTFGGLYISSKWSLSIFIFESLGMYLFCYKSLLKRK